MTHSQKDHQRFFKEAGDPGFSPEKNRSIVEETITKYERMRAEKMKEFDQALMERSDAALYYLKHTGDHGTPIEKYFSRQELARLQGRKIVEELQGRVRKLSYIS